MAEAEASNPGPSHEGVHRLGDILARIYPDLRRIASAKAASVGASPSSLAQETVCRLIALPTPPETDDSALALGCRLMEWTRVDRVRSDLARRAREAASRPPGESPGEHPPDPRVADALLELGKLSPRKAEVMMLSAICRMTQERIGEVLGVTARTVQRDLEFARAWIAARLSSGASQSNP